MAEKKKTKPMPDAGYKCMAWAFKIIDFFSSPLKRLEKVALKEGITVVDYGCGPGRYTIAAAKKVGAKGKVFAVDVQPLAVADVKKKAEKESLTNIEGIVVDGYDTGIQDSSADIVLLFDMLHMVGDPQALFRELHRIIRQSGCIYMDPGHMKVEKAKEIVEGSGLFVIAKCTGKDMVVVPNM